MAEGFVFDSPTMQHTGIGHVPPSNGSASDISHELSGSGSMYTCVSLVCKPQILVTS